MSSWQKLLGTNLKELRFIVCQNSSRSQGVRNFIAKNYSSLKAQNPNFPLIVRECEEADPYVIARYQFGVEKKAFIANNSEAEIEKPSGIVNQSQQSSSKVMFLKEIKGMMNNIKSL